jgi:phage tail sheath protein FI
MSTYLTPGVYVKEVPSGARPIQAVGTSTAGFVGVAPDASAWLHQPRAINGWLHFLREFGGDEPEQRASTHLAQAVHGFFLNGGSRCYVVNCGSVEELTGERQGLDALETIDEIAIVAAPGFTSAAAYDALLTHCERMEDRVCIVDGPKSVDSINSLTKIATAKLTKNREGENAEEPERRQEEGYRPRNSDDGYGAVYFPWIYAVDPMDTKRTIAMPPSGHLAGIYARTDASRGVHKAPANEVIRGALDVSYRLTRYEQGELNPQGVNCIRFFPREGIRVWGARTLAPASSEWRYINVRRLFNMIKESISQSTSWAVFEPNDEHLWQGLVRDISAFLTLLWRQGALLGGSPEEAFFVQCDRETNTDEVIEAGQVITRIGIAPVKPAEFVIFHIGQGAGGSTVEEKS